MQIPAQAGRAALARTIPLKFYQKLLFIQSSREAGQGTVAANDAMAWDKYADAIGADSLCHGPHAFFIANTLSNLHIASCFSVWYIEQCPPYPDLKNCADRVQRNVELFAIACKIFVKLSLCLFDNRGRRYSEICIYVSPDSTFVSLGTGHTIPVAQA